MAFNIEKYNKVKKELEQKANLLNRMEQEMKAEKRKEDAARKIKVNAPTNKGISFAKSNVSILFSLTILI
ncbi:hypothetical protein, partial [Salmonella enterica]|uniref:hypothetical protein n=1 Tax=Salmonella enterica TaxID=28901 RepID=UPI00111808BA